MKIRKVNSTIKRRVLREVSRECRKRNMMDKKGEIPNDIKDIWEAIKVLTKRNKQFAMHQCDYCCWYNPASGCCNCPYVMRRKACEKARKQKEEKPRKL